MIEIQGIEIKSLPLVIKEMVGVLLFPEYPVTTIFISNTDTPIIREWVDCNEDKTITRYYYYESSRKLLQSFLNGKISHLDLIRNAENIGFLVDEDLDNQIKQIKIVPPKQLPNEYLPNYDVYFSKDDGVETEKIIQVFDLDNVNEDDDDLIKKVAEDRKSEILNIHIKEGHGVGYGSINTRLFGEILLKFDDLYQQIGLDQIYGKNRGEFQKSNVKKNAPPDTDVIIQQAASYSIYIRPKFSQSNLFDNKTNFEQITNTMFNLFQQSESKETLKEAYSNYSPFVYRSYREFLDEQITREVNINIKWFEPNKKNLLKNGFGLQKAWNIRTYIDELRSHSSDSFEVKGKFLQINCKTRHYTFLTIDEQEYAGRFDKTLKNGLTLLNFQDLYSIKISVKITKEAGRVKPKQENTIIAYKNLKDNDIFE